MSINWAMLSGGVRETTIRQPRAKLSLAPDTGWVYRPFRPQSVLGASHQIGPLDDEAVPRFEAELAHGEAYQRAYQEFEEKQIAAGVPLDDPHFYDAFHAGREPIASPVGPEEWFAWVPRARMAEYAAERRRAWGFVGAGLAALAAAGAIRRHAGR